MSESTSRSFIVNDVLRHLDAVAIENMVGVGTPDINYLHGWIEQKYTKAWPYRATTPVRLDHDLTHEQRMWLRKRWKAGGNAHVLVQVGRDWLLFEGPTAADIIGSATKAELLEAAIGHWTSKNAVREGLPPCLSPRTS